MSSHASSPMNVFASQTGATQSHPSLGGQQPVSAASPNRPVSITGSIASQPGSRGPPVEPVQPASSASRPQTGSQMYGSQEVRPSSARTPQPQSQSPASLPAGVQQHPSSGTQLHPATPMMSTAGFVAAPSSQRISAPGSVPAAAPSAKSQSVYGAPSVGPPGSVHSAGVQRQSSWRNAGASVASASQPSRHTSAVGSTMHACPPTISAAGSTMRHPVPPTVTASAFSMGQQPMPSHTPSEPVQTPPAQRREIDQSHAAQQAGILASMAKAHEKMLREIYFQKLKRTQTNKKEAAMAAENAALTERVQDLEAKVAAGAAATTTVDPAATERVVYVDPISQPSRSVMWFAEFCGLPVTFRYVDLAAEENREPWFLAKNEEGQVPFYEEPGTGFGLAESTAILEYLAAESGKLALRDLPLGARSYVSAYFSKHLGNTRQLATQCFQPYLLAPPELKAQVLQEGLAAVEPLFQGFEALFSTQAYVAGAEPTLADFLCAPELDQFMLINQLDRFPHIIRYLNDLRGSRGCDYVRQEAGKRWQGLAAGTPLAQPAPRGRRGIADNTAAQQAGILASMSKAHEKMLREIYFQKLKRTQTNKKEVALQQRIAELEAQNATLREQGGVRPHHSEMKQSHAAQQAGILASMAKAHEKMLREIYFQKLKRTQTNKKEAAMAATIAELEAKLAEKDSVASGAPQRRVNQSHAAQQAGILASMSKAHEKMLREIYFQKLKRTQTNKKEAAMAAENAALREDNDLLRDEISQLQRREGEEAAAPGRVPAPSPQTASSRPAEASVDSAPARGSSPGALDHNRYISPMKAGAGNPPLEAKVIELEARIRDIERHGTPPRVRPDGAASPAQHVVAHENGTMAVTAVGFAAPGSPLPGGVGYTVRVACDVHGIKRNVRLQFPTIPRILTLVNAVNTVYDIIARGSHPPGCPDVPFNLAALQIFDTPQQRWVDLSDPMMHTGANDPQLFCFQQASIWHPDRPGTIPPAERVHTFITHEHAPPRVITTQPPPSQSAMMLAMFKDMDVVGGGKVRFQDVRDSLRRYGLELLDKTAGELFTAMDTRKDGVVTSDEWVDYTRDNPRFIETLYFKSLDAGSAALPPDVVSYNRPAMQTQDMVTSRIEAAADQLAPPFLPHQSW